MVRFDIDPGRAALVIVDMQECFVADSPIAAPLGQDVAGRLNRLAAACRQAFPSDGTANVDLPDGGLGPASAEELQRVACAVMAFGFAEVITVDQALSRIPVAVSG